MNRFLTKKIIASIVALALLVGVGVLISSRDTSSTTRNVALVVATPCKKPGQVTKVSKQSVVCATTNTGSLWYATMKTKGKAQACTKPGAMRKKSDIVWVCGVVKKKKLWQATQPLSALSAKGDLLSTAPDGLVVADNAVLADPQIPDDKTVTQIVDDATTPTIAPTTPTVAPTTPTTIPLTCAIGGDCNLRDIGPGGGIVFYVATTPFTCGEDLKAKCTYLEAAIAKGTTPSTWTPETKVPWGCDDISVRGTSLEIGTGRANTKIITDKNKNCIGSNDSDIAVRIAVAYNGGGKTDWFLPSRKELDALCNEFFKGNVEEGHSQDSCMGNYPNSRAVTGTNNGISWSFAGFSYWSSSETGLLTAWFQNFDYADQNTGDKGAFMHVRPVRAF
jgi:hypothetical protein